jgi:hypothetical protein
MKYLLSLSCIFGLIVNLQAMNLEDKSVLGKRKRSEIQKSLLQPSQKKRKVDDDQDIVDYNKLADTRNKKINVDWKWSNDEEEKLKEQLQSTNNLEKKLKLQDELRMFHYVGPQYFLSKKWNKKSKKLLQQSYQDHNELFEYIKKNFHLDKINLTQPFKIEKDNINLTKLREIKENEIINLIKNPLNYSWNQIIYAICTHNIYLIHNNQPKNLEQLFGEMINNNENYNYMNNISDAVLVETKNGIESHLKALESYPDLLDGLAKKIQTDSPLSFLRISYTNHLVICNTQSTSIVTIYPAKFLTTGFTKYKQNNTIFIITTSYDHVVKKWALPKTENLLYLLFIAKLQKAFSTKKEFFLHPDISKILEDTLPPHLKVRFATYLK